MLREMVQRRKLHFLAWTCNLKEGTRKNDHHRPGKVHGKRKRGRPPTSWLKDIKSSTGMTLQDAVRPAEDRERWQRIVKTIASHNATSDRREMWYPSKYIILKPIHHILPFIFHRPSNFEIFENVRP